MKLYLKFNVVIYFIFTFTFTYTFADDQAEIINFNGFSVNGLVVGKRFSVDKYYSKRYNILVPAPFEFIAPTQAGQFLRIHTEVARPALLQIDFMSSGTDKVKSSIQFLPMTLKLAPFNDNLQTLEKLLKTNFIKNAPATNKAVIKVIKIVKIGDYDAVELVGVYHYPKEKSVTLRIVAVSNPNQIHSIIAVIKSFSDNYEPQIISKVKKSNASRTPQNLKFISKT